MENPRKSLEQAAQARFMSSLRSAGVLLACFLVAALTLPLGTSFTLAVAGIFLGIMAGTAFSGMADALRKIYLIFTKDENGLRLALVSIIGVAALILLLHSMSGRSQRSFGTLFEILQKTPSYAFAIGVTAVPSFLATLWWLARRRRPTMSRIDAEAHGNRRDRNKRRRRSS
jgi:hypothetical protein